MFDGPVLCLRKAGAYGNNQCTFEEDNKMEKVHTALDSAAAHPGRSCEYNIRNGIVDSIAHLEDGVNDVRSDGCCSAQQVMQNGGANYVFFQGSEVGSVCTHDEDAAD